MDDYRGQQSTIEAASVLWNISRAFLARLIFVVHSVATVWQTALVTGADWLWGFALLILLVVFEGSHTIIMRAGGERKWFCTSVLLYVMATAPPIWMLERHLCDLRASNRAFDEDGDKEEEEIRVQMVEQVMLVVLIVGRWLLPKGDISSEQLSQILLAYLAISSDIVEFFDVFKEPAVFRHRYVQHIILLAWTLSLFQFPFVLTVSRARKMRVAITKTDDFRLRSASGVWKMSHDVDLWAIVLANSLQDIPFLLVRLYLMFYHRLYNYTLIFFTCKNALIIVLQTYRAIILINDRYLHPPSKKPSVSEGGADEGGGGSEERKRRKRRRPPPSGGMTALKRVGRDEEERRTLCERRNERHERGERYERADRSERSERGERAERMERSERHKRPEDQNKNFSSSSRSRSHPR